jgi:hypothetical protein
MSGLWRVFLGVRLDGGRIRKEEDGRWEMGDEKWEVGFKIGSM